MKKVIFILIFVLLFGFAAVLAMRGKNSNPSDEEGRGGITFKEFLPFGNNNDEEGAGEEGAGTGGGNTGPNITPGIPTPEAVSKVSKIYSTSVAGITAVSRLRESATFVSDSTTATAPTNTILLAPAVRIVESATGHIKDVFPDTKEVVSVSSRTIPKIHEAIFGGNGTAIIYRFLGSDLETIQTFAGKIGAGTSPDNALTGSFLPENILDVASDASSGKIFYLSLFGSGSSGSTAEADASKKTQIMELPLYEWNTKWLNGDILFTTKPSGEVLGYTYRYNPKTKVFGKVIGAIPGLTTLPSTDGNKILLGEYRNSSVSLSAIKSDGTGRENISIETLPEKCIFMKLENSLICSAPSVITKGVYPDVWYQGRISFSDTIIKYDFANRTETLVSMFPEQVDGTNLSLSEDEKYLYLINKKDGAVWAVELK